MGRKSRNKRMRKLLRPGTTPANQPGRRSPTQSTSAAKTKVKRLLEAMVDAAYEDLASGAEKPRVSYGQALRAGELLVRYEEDEADETAAGDGTDETAEEVEVERAYNLTADLTHENREGATVEQPPYTG